LPDTVEKSDPAPDIKPKSAPKEKPAPIVERVSKGFQVEATRAQKWDVLVAQMKNRKGDDKRTGPQLIDEALDHLFMRYLGEKS